jgi:alkylation response protein AidB-like acyl-CoA dehydrogenase
MLLDEMANRGLSDETRMMKDVTRKFSNEHVIPFVRQNWKAEWNMNPDERLPRRILEKANEIGIRTLGVPEEFGGTPLDPATETQSFAVISEEISRGDCGLAEKLVQIWKVSVLLRNVAPRHLQEKWFPQVVKDPTFLLSHCLTEPRGASDRWLPYDVPEAMMHTKAEFKNGKWVINGRKQFITNAYDAKLYVVYATTKPGAGMTKGTSCFLVPRDTPGLSVARCNETLGGRFMNNGEIVLENCEVPKDHLLVEDVALAKAGIYFRPGKIIQGSKNIGVGVRAFEETSRYVQDYVQGGKKLIKHQATALRLAEMATRICAVRGLLREAANAVDQKLPEAEVLCNMVKNYASQSILEVCRNAMELHGGNGTMLEFGIEKLYRDASMYLHMDGTVDVTNFKIAKNLFPDTAGKYAGND